jgi:enoyl-CoA hydratase/carnithine racemase
MEDQSFVKLEVEEGIGRLTFYHEKKNSMPALQLKRLAEAVAEASERSDIKVIVLQSAGDSSFCAGASFDELVAIESAGASNPGIRVLQNQQAIAEYIDIADENTVLGVMYLVSQGILTHARGLEILTP